jgi:hypothetical protein
VGYDDQPSGEQSQSDKPLFLVTEPAVFERDTGPGKHPFRVFEAQAVLGKALPVLRFAFGSTERPPSSLPGYRISRSPDRSLESRRSLFFSSE